MPANTKMMKVYFMPPKSTSYFYGSTKLPGNVNLLDSTGNTYAQLDWQLEATSLSLPVTELTTYYLEVTRPDTTVGTNDFYFLRFYTKDSDNYEETEPNNGTMGTAGTPTYTDDNGVHRYYVMGNSDATDTDYWQVTGQAGGHINLACRAARAGSGLDGMTVAIHDASDTELQVETEVDTQNVYWGTSSSASMSEIASTTATNYYLKVTATGQDANVSSSFYRCGIHVYPQ